MRTHNQEDMDTRRASRDREAQSDNVLCSEEEGYDGNSDWQIFEKGEEPLARAFLPSRSQVSLGWRSAVPLT